MKEREYKRALNATKIERFMAKPFIKALPHHKEAVTALFTNNKQVINQSYDSEIVLWNFKTFETQIFSNFLDSKIEINDKYFYVSDQKIIKAYKNETNQENDNYDNKISDEAIHTYCVNANVHNLKCTDDELAAVTENGIELFKINQVNSFSSFVGSYKNVLFNDNLICGYDYTATFFDRRVDKKLFVMKSGTRINEMVFGMGGLEIFIANDDGNAYCYDIRYMKNDNLANCDGLANTDNLQNIIYARPSQIYRGHVNAVMAIQIANNEVITGSLDKTIRIYKKENRKSRDVYYNKRMGSVRFLRTVDNKIISGSDDGNIRIWRQVAYERDNMNRRQREALDYSKKLKEKYKDVEEISRIDKHRFVPKSLKGLMKTKNEAYLGGIRRKEKYEKKKQKKEEE